jgi:hypothetical protein
LKAAMMLQAIYCSKATRKFSEDELHAILELARNNNYRDQITGMLAFDDGVFMQVIEGPDDTIERLLEKLNADLRHGELRVLSIKPIEHREFGFWDMAYFREASLADQPDGYIDLASIQNEFAIDGTVATQMLGMFQNGLFADAAEGHEDTVGSCTVTIRPGPSSDPSKRRYLTEFGRAMALSLPDVPIVVGTPKGGDVTFNQRRELHCGEIEMF